MKFTSILCKHQKQINEIFKATLCYDFTLKNHEKYMYYKNCTLWTLSLNFPLPLLMVT